MFEFIITAFYVFVVCCVKMERSGKWIATEPMIGVAICMMCLYACLMAAVKHTGAAVHPSVGLAFPVMAVQFYGN